MLITHEREKLINAIIYFARHTQYLGKIKLFKLLYLLDFEHFRQTGQNVTGLTYSAQQYGPMPVALAQEWDKPKPDLAVAIAIQPEQAIDYKHQTAVPALAAGALSGLACYEIIGGYKSQTNVRRFWPLRERLAKFIDQIRQAIVPLPEFDDSHFSKRELRIMSELAKKYRKAYSPKVIDVTRAQNGAWAKVWNNGKGSDHPIPYNLTIPDDDPHREAILEAAKEYQAIVNSARC